MRNRNATGGARRLPILLPWAAVPLLLLSYWLAWGRLPARMVTQVSWSGQPASSMTRGQCLAFELAVLAFVLSSFTLKVWGRNSEPGRRRKLVTYYVAVVLLLAVFEWVLFYNLK